MEKVEVVLKFMKHIVWGLVLEGVLVIFIGLLIFAYPDLLGMLVGLFLIFTGVLSFFLAYKTNKYASFKFRL